MKKTNKLMSLAVITFTVASITACSTQVSDGPQSVLEPKKTAAKKVEVKQRETKIKPYPLKICLVSDEPLDEWDDMQTMVYQGQEMKFCCTMCLKKFKKTPQKYISILAERNK